MLNKHLKEFCNHHGVNREYVIALSGGLDSCVLLHAMGDLKKIIPSLKISAIHVNHGLSTNADKWQIHCENFCKELNVELRVFNVDIDKDNGDSLEASARESRYGVFKNFIQEQSQNTKLNKKASLSQSKLDSSKKGDSSSFKSISPVVKLSQNIRKNTLVNAASGGITFVTAHHQDDQAETVLLQLLRGSGPKGLAAMPMIAPFDKGFLARPLLDFTREELEKYASNNKLKWIKDESNDCLDHSRNFIRHKIMPLLQERWPATTSLLSRTASHCAEADKLTTDLAQKDLLGIYQPEQETLLIPELSQLSRPRQKQVIRYWLDQRGLPPLSAVKLEQILDEVIPARIDATPVVSWAGGEVRRFHAHLYANPPLTEHDPSRSITWDVRHPLTLPGDLGIVQGELQRGKGLAIDRKAVTSLVTVRFRQGGEKCNLPGRLGSQTLKNLFQEWSVPVWMRDRTPLIYVGDELAAVVGYCVCDGFVAKSQGLGWVVSVMPISEKV